MRRYKPYWAAAVGHSRIFSVLIVIVNNEFNDIEVNLQIYWPALGIRNFIEPFIFISRLFNIIAG